MLKILFLMVALLLSACAESLVGTYVDAMGLSSYTFANDNKAYVAVLGIETEVTYEVDGDRVKLMMPEGNMVLHKMDDGTLQGPVGIVYSKKK
jgi:hypothetical protein